MRRACFYKRADSRYALVNGRKRPWLYSRHRTGPELLDYVERGWLDDKWTRKFFADLDGGEAVFVRVDDHSNLWPSHLWRIEVVETGDTLRVKLRDKVDDLKWSRHEEAL